MLRYMPLIAVLLLAVPAARAADSGMGATLDIKAISTDYARSCQDRLAIRLSNMQASFDPATPRAFAAPNGEFVRHSPNLSAAQKNLAVKLFQGLPAHIRDFAYLYGVVYTFPRVVADAVPLLRDDKDYYNDLGLYIARERHAYIPLGRAVIERGSDGAIKVRRYESSGRDRRRMIIHESGHAVDDLLGRISLSESDDRHLTGRADYRAAFDRDLSDLTAIPGVSRNETIMRRGYYLPEEHNGILIGGQRKNEQRARREVFAELWAEIHGTSPHRLSEIYPRSYGFVQKVDILLRNLHEHAPVRCNYNAEGAVRD